jgi:hypothetical protein
MPELKVSWVSKEREELEEVEYQLPSQQGLFYLLIKKTGISLSFYKVL